MRRGEARRGEARRGEARRGEARRGEARRGEARRGEARRGEVIMLQGDNSASFIQLTFRTRFIIVINYVALIRGQYNSFT